MSIEASTADLSWDDAVLAMDLFAVDPAGLGGVVVRAAAGPSRDGLCARMRDALAEGAPIVRLPLHVTRDRLLGGLSLAATLRAGRVVAERGLLAQASGGVVVAAMAERLESDVTSHLCAAVDRGELALERDGMSALVTCRIGVVALDEGQGDESAPHALRDRLAFHVDLAAVPPRTGTGAIGPARARVASARARLAGVTIEGDVIDALCRAASALGIASVRAPLLAVACARAHAALEGRASVEEDDATAAARLVLGPRAVRLGAPDEAEPIPGPDDALNAPNEDDGARAEPPSDPRDLDPRAASAPPTEDAAEDSSDTPPSPRPDHALDEIVLAAAKSAIPSGLLDTLVMGREARGAPRSEGRAGAVRASLEGGRPAGTLKGAPGRGERLNVVETLRAAAPWQRLRRAEGAQAGAASALRVLVRKEDFRLTRFRRRSGTSVIFCVDASGSSALQRLAEAKGAAEQVLADCYVRRDHVALIAFRATTATLVLPPTRSLARVRRGLADLAGGGTTPLAAGIDCALSLAVAARTQGRTPVVVLMTDGRANVGRNGREGAAAATEDAMASARTLRAAGVRTLFLDTAPRPRPQARLLSAELGARYLPLPYLDAVGISRHVQSLGGGAR